MSRGRGFTQAELDGLLDIIEDLLPIGPNDWDRLAERHCTYYPGLGRSRESLKRKFALLYNHKKPTGDPTCPATVRRAKRVWERIKEEMDVSDGKRSNDDNGILNEAVDGSKGDVPILPTMEDESVNENNQGLAESDDAVSQGGVAGSMPTGRTPSADGNALNEIVLTEATMPVLGTQSSSTAGIRVRTPRHARSTPVQSGQSSLSDLMQFMLVRADTESTFEQRRRQEREDVEDRRRREREEAEDHHRREREEAEERRERRMERQLQNQSEMMQIFMMSMMEGRMKRKRDHESDEEGNNTKD